MFYYLKNKKINLNILCLATEDAIISDELNHASIIDGIRLSKAKRLRYKHMEIEDLEKQLIQTKGFLIKIEKKKI